MGEVVDQDRLAVFEAAARAGQQVRGAAHRLHAAGDDDVGGAAAQELVGQADGAHAREADLVDRQGRHAHGQSGGDGGLAGGVLAASGGQDLPEDDLVDEIGADAGAFDRGPDGGAGQVGGGHVGEGAVEPPDGCAGGGEDDDVVVHADLRWSNTLIV